MLGWANGDLDHDLARLWPEARVRPRRQTGGCTATLPYRAEPLDGAEASLASLSESRGKRLAEVVLIARAIGVMVIGGQTLLRPVVIACRAAKRDFNSTYRAEGVRVRFKWREWRRRAQPFARR